MYDRTGAAIPSPFASGGDFENHTGPNDSELSSGVSPNADGWYPIAAAIANTIGQNAANTQAQGSPTPASLLGTIDTGAPSLVPGLSTAFDELERAYVFGDGTGHREEFKSLYYGDWYYMGLPPSKNHRTGGVDGGWAGNFNLDRGKPHDFRFASYKFTQDEGMEEEGWSFMPEWVLSAASWQDAANNSSMAAHLPQGISVPGAAN